MCCDNYRAFVLSVCVVRELQQKNTKNLSYLFTEFWFYEWYQNMPTGARACQGWKMPGSAIITTRTNGSVLEALERRRYQNQNLKKGGDWHLLFHGFCERNICFT